MPEPIALDLEVMKGATRQDEFQAILDPADHAALQKALEAWLADNKWDRGRWGQFTLRVREAGRSKVIKTVRVRG